MNLINKIATGITLPQISQSILSSFSSLSISCMASSKEASSNSGESKQEIEISLNEKMFRIEGDKIFLLVINIVQDKHEVGKFSLEEDNKTLCFTKNNDDGEYEENKIELGKLIKTPQKTKENKKDKKKSEENATTFTIKFQPVDKETLAKQGIILNVDEDFEDKAESKNASENSIKETVKIKINLTSDMFDVDKDNKVTVKENKKEITLPEKDKKKDKETGIVSINDEKEVFLTVADAKEQIGNIKVDDKNVLTFEPNKDSTYECETFTLGGSTGIWGGIKKHKVWVSSGVAIAIVGLGFLAYWYTQDDSQEESGPKISPNPM